MRAVKDSLPPPLENVKNQKTLFDGSSRTNTGVVPREKTSKLGRSIGTLFDGRLFKTNGQLVITARPLRRSRSIVSAVPAGFSTMYV